MMIAIPCLLFSCTDREPDMNKKQVDISFGVNSADFSETAGAVTKPVAKLGKVGKKELCMYCTEEPMAPVTRGSIINTGNISDIGVFAFVNDKGTTDYKEYFADVKAEKLKDWKIPFHWLNSGKQITFIAYAPYGIINSRRGYPNSGLFVRNSDRSIGMAWISPTDIKQQKDFLYASIENIDGNSNKSQKLTFKHLLAGVRFKVGDLDEGTISKIEITGVETVAQLWLGYSSNGSKLLKSSIAKTITFSDVNFSVTSTPKGNLITSEVFFAIPQTLKKYSNGNGSFLDPKINITYTPKDGEETTLTAPIIGKDWEAGKMYTYTISYDSGWAIEGDLGNFGDGGEI